MATIDWDWQEEVTTCRGRIFCFEVQIEVQKLDINRLLKTGSDIKLVAHTLAITEENLKRAQDHKRFIEAKMTGDAGRDSAV